MPRHLSAARARRRHAAGPSERLNARPAARLALQAALSVFRGIAAGSGLLSTVIFPPLQRAAGLTAAGAVGFAWLDACLLAGALPVAVSAALGRPLSSLQGADGAAESGGAAKDAFGVASAPPLLLLLMFGLALSRLGIWLADLAVSQMQQELVDDSEIGAGGSHRCMTQWQCGPRSSRARPDLRLARLAGSAQVAMRATREFAAAAAAPAEH